MNNSQINNKILTLKYELPIYHPSPILVYLHYAYYLSIVLADERNWDWYLSHFIHYYVNLDEKDHIFDFYFPGIIDFESSLPLHVYKIQNELLEIDKIQIIDDIIRWINNGYYIRLEINEKFITGTNIASDMLHPVFIYGYNLTDKIFYSCNFNKEYQYMQMQLPFADIETAFYAKNNSSLISYTHYTFLIVLYKPSHSFFSFNIVKLVEELAAYAKGTNISHAHPYHRCLINNNSFWGIKIYQGIHTYLESACGEGIDYRIFHGLWEHKKVMMSRLHYLEQNRYLKPELGLTKKYSGVEIMCNTLRGQALKYYFTKKKNFLEKSIQLVNEVCLAEESVIHILLNELHY